MTNSSSKTVLPLKSVAVSLLFCAILGPVGVLYSTVTGSVIMILLGFVTLSSKLFIPILLTWVISCIVGVVATNRYNKKIFSGNI